MQLVFGVDIGGTDIKIGAFSSQGELIQKWSVKTDLEGNGSRIIPDVAANIQGYLHAHHMQEGDILGIGMGIPGPVDDKGYVRTCANLKWNGVYPAAELKKYFPNARIAAGNDANVAALGEYHKGCGKDASSMMMITLGTGVGGGIIIDGRIIAGARGLAGEIGHVALNPSAWESCSCGNKGCINECASATGLIKYAKRMLETDTRDSLLREIPELTAKNVCDSAKQGDPLAMECIKRCMAPLGAAMAHISHAIDPELFVIGGGVSHAGQLLLDAIGESYASQLFLVSKGADIRLAELGNDAGIIGACMLAITG